MFINCKRNYIIGKEYEKRSKQSEVLLFEWRFASTIDVIVFWNRETEKSSRKTRKRAVLTFRFMLGSAPSFNNTDLQFLRFSIIDDISAVEPSLNWKEILIWISSCLYRKLQINYFRSNGFKIQSNDTLTTEIFQFDDYEKSQIEPTLGKMLINCIESPSQRWRWLSTSTNTVRRSFAKQLMIC